jgi:hypothetical protein
MEETNTNEGFYQGGAWVDTSRNSVPTVLSYNRYTFTRTSVRCTSTLYIFKVTYRLQT